MMKPDFERLRLFCEELRELNGKDELISLKKLSEIAKLLEYCENKAETRRERFTLDTTFDEWKKAYLNLKSRMPPDEGIVFDAETEKKNTPSKPRLRIKKPPEEKPKESTALMKRPGSNWYEPISRDDKKFLYQIRISTDECESADDTKTQVPESKPRKINKAEWDITGPDKRFLRSLRIASEDPDPEENNTPGKD